MGYVSCMKPVYSFVLALTAALVPVCSPSQVPSFQKMYTYTSPAEQSVGTSIIQTSDGGYVFAEKSSGLTLTKTDINGNLLWRKCAYNQLIHSVDEIQENAAGNLIVTGLCQDSVTSAVQYFMMKADASGNVIWWKKYEPGGGYEVASIGGYLGSDCYGYSGVRHELFASGEIVFAGAVKNPAFAFSYLLHVTKTDSAGNVTWTKFYDDTTYYKGVFDMTCTRSSVEQLPDVYYILTNGKPQGVTQVTAIREDGTQLWSKYYDTLFFSGCAIEYTSTNELVITGISSNPQVPTLRDMMVMKIDTSGNVIWANAYDHAFDVEWGNCIRETASGDFVVAGGMSNGTWSMSAMMTKITAAGVPVWAGQYELPANVQNNAASSAISSDGGCVFIGYTAVNFFVNNTYLVKTDSSGLVGCGLIFQNTSVLPIVPFITPVGKTVNAQLTTYPVYFSNQFKTATELASCSTLVVAETVPLDPCVIVYHSLSGMLSVTAPKNISRVEIYDSGGRMIRADQQHAQVCDVDLSGCVPGVYIYHVLLETGEVQSGKLVRTP